MVHHGRRGTIAIQRIGISRRYRGLAVLLLNKVMLLIVGLILLVFLLLLHGLKQMLPVLFLLEFQYLQLAQTLALVLLLHESVLILQVALMLIIVRIRAVAAVYAILIRLVALVAGDRSRLHLERHRLKRALIRIRRQVIIQQTILCMYKQLLYFNHYLINQNIE